MGPLVVENAQVSGNDLVLQNGSWWDVNTVTVVGNNDNRSLKSWLTDGSDGLKNVFFRLVMVNYAYLETDVFPERDITRYRQVVSFQHVRDGFEAGQEFRNLKIPLFLVSGRSMDNRALKYFVPNGLTDTTYNTFLKCSSPSLTSGVVLNWRWVDIMSEPDFSSYRLDMTRSRSDVFLTGKKRDL